MHSWCQPVPVLQAAEGCTCRIISRKYNGPFSSVQHLSMQETLLEAQNQAEICPLLCLSCLFPFPKMSLIRKCDFSLLTALEMPFVSLPSCHSMLFTEIPALFLLPAAPVNPAQQRVWYGHPGHGRALCHSLTLLLCRGQGTERFLCAADAGFRPHLERQWGLVAAGAGLGAPRRQRFAQWQMMSK